MDGYNLLHAWDRATPQQDDLEAARRRLLDALAAFAGRDGERVTAVFDGIPLPYPDRGRHRGIRVRFSRTPQDADRLIGELLDKSDHTRETAVVSSDRAVQARALSAGARILSSEAFARTLREVPRAAPDRGGGAQAPLSEAQVADWARLFGVSPADGLSPAVTRRRRRRA